MIDCTDEELIEEVFNRALKSDIFCMNMIIQCKDFIKYLEKDN